MIPDNTADMMQIWHQLQNDLIYFSISTLTVTYC